MENNQPNALDITIKMGRMLLENGAEISRVQGTMERVAKTLDIDEFNIFVLTNAVFTNGKYQGVSSGTKFKYIPSFAIRLDKITMLNQLSREIAEGSLSLKQIDERLVEIQNSSTLKLWKKVLACGIGTACFCNMFGGTLVDCSVALICGLIVECLIYQADKWKVTKFLSNIIISAVVTMFSILMTTKFGIGDNLNMVIIGAIIRLVPGMAMTTSIRDFFDGDYLSGTIRLIDALIVGGSIAVGVGAVVSIFLGGAVL